MQVGQLKVCLCNTSMSFFSDFLQFLCFVFLSTIYYEAALHSAVSTDGDSLGLYLRLCYFMMLVYAYNLSNAHETSVG